MRVRWRSIGVAFVLCFAGCATLDRNHFRTFIVDESVSAEFEYRGLRLQSGELIVGDAGGADTLLLSLLGTEYSPFVHSGILVVEDGRPYVYDAFATINPFFIHGPPTDAMSGGIRRVTLEHYLRGQRIAAIFEPPNEVDRARVAAFAQARNRDGTPFDAYFDWRDHSRLYCTEFVALALQAGGQKSPSLVPVRNNPSLRSALHWLKVDAPEIVTAQSLIGSSRRTALLSRNLSPNQIASYFDAKRELHARFTDDQKLGNVWTWTWRGLALQTNVAAFLKASSDRPESAASQLAEEFFVP